MPNPTGVVYPVDLPSALEAIRALMEIVRKLQERVDSLERGA